MKIDLNKHFKKYILKINKCRNDIATGEYRLNILKDFAFDALGKVDGVLPIFWQYGQQVTENSFSDEDDKYINDIISFGYTHNDEGKEIPDYLYDTYEWNVRRNGSTVFSLRNYIEAKITDSGVEVKLKKLVFPIFDIHDQSNLDTVMLTYFDDNGNYVEEHLERFKDDLYISYIVCENFEEFEEEVSGYFENRDDYDLFSVK